MIAQYLTPSQVTQRSGIFSEFLYLERILSATDFVGVSKDWLYRHFRIIRTEADYESGSCQHTFVVSSPYHEDDVKILLLRVIRSVFTSAGGIHSFEPKMDCDPFESEPPRFWFYYKTHEFSGLICFSARTKKISLQETRMF